MADPASDQPLARLARLVWMPENGEPIELATESDTTCGEDAIRVVDSVEGPTVVYRQDGIGAEPYASVELGTIVLATGEKQGLGIGLAGSDLWSAATGTVVTRDPELRVRLWDVADGSFRNTAPVQLGASASAIALGPDATSLAVVHGDSTRSVWIYDLTTGEVIFEAPVDVAAASVQLSYDGDVVAVGDLQGVRTEVFDVAEGTSRTIEVAGLLP